MKSSPPPVRRWIFTSSINTLISIRRVPMPKFWPSRKQTWGPIMADIEAAFDTFANGRRVPIAVTEHNLFAVPRPG